MSIHNLDKLVKPVSIADQRWPAEQQPLVSILCTTYNHSQYISECINGFLAQETTFPVEIIIRDDASTDGTSEIVQHYAKTHPQLIKAVLLPENQWRQGVKPMPDAFRYSSGEFIASCEGDDHWISTYKLQEQVELLEKTPGAILCGARAFVIRDGSRTPYTITPDFSSEALSNFGPVEMLQSKWYFKTLTRIAPRWVWQDYIDLVKNDPSGCDWLFVLFCISKSKMEQQAFVFLDEAVAIYREHAGGVWSGLDQKRKNESDIRVLSFALRNFSFGKHNVILEKNLIHLCKENEIASTGIDAVDRCLSSRPSEASVRSRHTIWECLLNCMRR